MRTKVVTILLLVGILITCVSNKKTEKNIQVKPIAGVECIFSTSNVLF